jgi:hypothetical protein
MVRYLLDGTLPPEGTVCPANRSPFLPAPAFAGDETNGLSAAGLPTFVPEM